MKTGRRDRQDYQKAWRVKNLESIRRNQRAYYYENREKIREKYLKSKYGIDEASWNALFLSQDNQCAICQTNESGSRMGWHTDHDHNTGEVRAILCNNCNILIGHAHDDPRVCESAAAYLRKYEKRPYELVKQEVLK